MFWTVTLVWLAAAATPGLNFLIVTRNALTGGRLVGMATTTGVALGTLTLSFAAWAGLSGFFAAFPATLRGLTLAGGGFILWSGAKLLLSAARLPNKARETAPPPQLSPRKAALFGYLTAVANPKALIFILSLFAAILPLGTAGLRGLAVVVQIPAISFLWFTLVALALSTPRLSALFLRQARRIDALAGLAFLAIGLRLVLS